MPLLTTPYDPNAGITPAMNVIQIAMQARQQQQAIQEQRDRALAATIAASTAEQNRAAEYKSTLDFNKAKSAQDDAERQAKLAEDKRQFDVLNAPFVMPGSTRTSPSASAVSAVGQDFSLVNPDGSTSDTIQTPSQALLRSGSVFGLVPDGAGGYMADPNDRTDSKVPGFDPNKGAYGANIKDPSLKGAAVSIADMRAAGIDPEHPGNAMVEVTGSDGTPHRYPIVDKLGTPGRVDFTLGAYNELGGPQSKGGGLIPNLQTKIIPGDSGTSAPSIPPSQQVLVTLGRTLESQGVPRHIAMEAITATAKTLALRDQAGASKPIVRNMADGTSRSYNPSTGSWDIIASKADAQNDVTDGMTFNAAHNTYVKDDGSEWFVNGGKLRSYIPPTVKAKEIFLGSDGNVYPIGNDGKPMTAVPEGVTLRDPRQKVPIAKTPNGDVFKVNSDGTASLLIPSNVMPKSKDREAYVSDLQDAQNAQATLEARKKILENPSWDDKIPLWGISQSKVDEAQKAADSANAKLETWAKVYPGLKQVAPDAAPAAAPAAPPVASAPGNPTVWRKGKDGTLWEYDSVTKQPTGNHRAS